VYDTNKVLYNAYFFRALKYLLMFLSYVIKLHFLFSVLIFSSPLYLHNLFTGKY